MLDIVDVVSSYVDLCQTRKAYRGLCPFHQDYSNSFFVHPLHQSYLCATCGAHGNVVKFVEEIEGFLLDDVMEKLSTGGDYVTSGMELTIEQWLHSAGYRQIEYVHVTAGLRKFVCQAVLPAAPVMALVEAFFGSYPLNDPLELWILPDNRRCLTFNNVLAERQDFNREQWDFITCANRLLKRKVQMDFRNAVRFARS